MKFPLKCLLFAAVLSLFALISIPPAQSQAFILPTLTSQTGATNLLVTASSTTNIFGPAVPVRKDRGLSILPQIGTTNSGTEAVTFNIQLSVDGTNWSTVGPGYALALNGATGVRGYTNIPPDVVNNVRYWRLGTIVNAHAASIWITNFTYSYNN